MTHTQLNRSRCSSHKGGGAEGSECGGRRLVAREVPRAGCRHATHLSALPSAVPVLRSLATARGTPGRPGATVLAEGGGSGRDRAGAAACKTAATRGKPHAAMGESSA